MTRSALARRGFAAARAIADWPEIVGPALAESSVPERLVRGRNAESATLVVRVRSAAALELQHWLPQVIERVNGYFGFRASARSG
ncbi:MAG: DciA family protein [Pseudomonadota bacterium]